MSPVAGSSNNPAHDYTEGASAIDINEAMTNRKLSRRDSQYSSYFDNDEEGAVFAGPGHTANPSSVSRMSNVELGRRSSDTWSRTRSRRQSYDSSSRHRLNRRVSGDSRSSLQSADQSEGQGEADEDALLRSDDEGSERGPNRKSRKRVSSPQRQSVFENFANLFSRSTTVDEPGQHRRSISRKSSASLYSRGSRRSRRTTGASEHVQDSDEREERWGYSSEEEDESDQEPAHVVSDNASIAPSMQYDSEPSTPPRPTHSLPLLTMESVFDGEARIDMDVSSTFLNAPPPGPPSRQTLYIADEDSTIRFIGYETIRWRARLWKIACVLSFGILSLLGHWFPRLWLRWVAIEKAFVDSVNGFIVVESAYRTITLQPIHVLGYHHHIFTVFPPDVPNGQSSELYKSSLEQKIDEHLDSQDGTLKKLLVVDYRYTRYALDPRTGLFAMVKDWRDPAWTSVGVVQGGLSSGTTEQRTVIFGKNEIDVEGKSTLALLIDEVIHPFYIFQIASIILWSLDDYYYYAFCIALISCASIVSTLVETRKTINRMREMSRFNCKLVVLRNNEWIELDSTELVPGDIVNLSDSECSMIPADLFLLTGDAIINESMLTGESVPVSKIPMKDEDVSKWRKEREENPKCFLYGGTKIVRIRGSYSQDELGKPATALVARTGFNTTKGALVRSMLFPKPIGFKFYRDSIRFIGVLAGIAGIGFCFSAVQFVRIGVAFHTIIIRALDLITVVVPPALPATLAIGTSFAITRLRKKDIYCTAPSRVNVAGKINVCCFDKTGTLTEDGLDVLGVRGLERNIQMFGELLEDVYDIPLSNSKASLLHALATCHSLKLVDDEVIGDPLDVKMFEFTKWTLEEGRVSGTGVIKSKGMVIEQAALVQTVVRPPGSAQFRLEDALKGAAKHAHFLELGVIRTFEFVSSLRRMSVIVKRLKSSSMEIYVKGAPEVMADICEKESFPQDYDDLLSYYTRRGYRVIAMAGKSVEGLSWLKAQRMKREQAESKLSFLGLIIFENRLKPATTPTIQQLRTAHLACRMITGDNPLTAVSVARECSLINQAVHVFAPAFRSGDVSTPSSKIEWTSMDDPLWKLDSYSLKPLAPLPHHMAESDEIDYQDYSLVISGDVFRWMINHAPLETLQRMLVKTQIFARMSPDEKNEIVERLQALGYTVLMCGDGANDCAALKAADVGISLSEAEASVAAPFTTTIADIGCVVEVIKEGRTALVTSFSCFKYMALYSLIQFTSVTLLYSFASSLGDFQFLYIDLFIIIPVAVTMAWTLPFPQIHPKRPTASLVSKRVLASIIGQIIITSGFQLWGFLWVKTQPWYTPPPANDPNSDNNKLESTNYENTVLFLISCFQYILVAAVFSIGPPYRKPMWTNGWLLCAMIILSGFNVLVLMAPPKPIQNLLTLKMLPMSAKITLIAVVFGNIATSLAFEQWGSQVAGGMIGTVMRWWQRGRRRVMGGKVYKAVEGGMR